MVVVEDGMVVMMMMIFHDDSCASSWDDVEECESLSWKRRRMRRWDLACLILLKRS